MNAHISPRTDCDIAIVGGGLAGGLIALALTNLRPELTIMLIEGDDTLGGNHVWSFFDSDIRDADRWLVEPMIAYRWDGGHDVRFPRYGRTLIAAYNSIPSARFDAHLRERLGDRVMTGKAASTLDPTHVTLSDGQVICARSVIDARGFRQGEKISRPMEPDAQDRGFTQRDPTGLFPHRKSNVIGPAISVAGPFSRQDGSQGSDPALPAPCTGPLVLGTDPLETLDCGWQKFVGQTLRLAMPHGLIRPVIMDATVPQIDGYRFVYVLPMGETEIFVEDTYYSDGPELDAQAIRLRIAEYARVQGWQVEAIVHEETGALPVVIGGDFDRFWPRGDLVARAGVRAGLFHPTTGYSLPQAVSFALDIAAMDRLDGASLALATRALAQGHWRSGGYYRLLDTMLFRAAHPDQRYKIFERFYALSEPLIARFYAGRSSTYDKMRILCGRPPVPIRAAMQALIQRRGP